MYIKCPLCYSQIKEDELRSSQIVVNRIPKKGEMIDFHLVSHQKNCTIIQDEAIKKTNEPYLYIPGVVPLSRIVLTYDVTPIIEKERKRLTEALQLAIEFQRELMASFLNEGLKELDQRQTNFNKTFAKSVFRIHSNKYRSAKNPCR